ncbi:hypothetical protein PILCRDRAFT_95170 [Piloderma croceum F 1598]|uniref:tRNA-splicing endonuclease subunit Sen15 domain-containing protein n=1 Tax=Piloderma croceum (strain F 1598) TaxID=765440 RepID=A0A0C3FYD7_PILCF|nr:hypothetical protein PILCRDRAFT_95170 [Piloderma croceum F 1598]
MENHPSYPALSSVLPKYPRAAGALFQAYNDILFAQQWSDVEVIDLASCSRGAVKGRRPQTDETLCVVPCSLAESISTSWLHDAFKELQFPKEIYLAITSEDASIVYYKISRGIVKPPV